MKSFEQPPLVEASESHEEPVQYLYHRVPENLVGDVLYPLNKLKEVDSATYVAAVAKYEERKEIMQQQLPGGELWNDVLHFTPVHPSKIKEALMEAGATVKPTEWFQISVRSINTSQATVFQEEKFQSFDEANLHEGMDLPEATKKHYRQAIAAGERPFLFHDAPPVLYHGHIPLAECTKITV